MKILHAHTSLHNGGIEAMVTHLANDMSKRNEVSVLSIFEPDGKFGFLDKLDRKISFLTAGKKSPGFSFKTIYHIYRIIRKGGYDVVHIHGFFFYYALAVMLLHRKMKFFYTIHSDASKENGRWDRKLFKIKRYCFARKWMTSVTISKESLRSFKECYRLDSAMVYNGIPRPEVHPFDMNSYRKTTSTKILFHPGRISKEKNQVMLCKNVERLIEEGYDIVLLIAGDNQHNDVFSELSQYLSDRIIYLGNRNDVTDIMAAADAFCLSSIYEGLPVTLLEAMAVGCIPVCTPVGGIPELVHNGLNGLLSASSSEENYYQALSVYLATTDARLQSMKEALKKDFEQFEIGNAARMYEKLYNEMTQ